MKIDQFLRVLLMNANFALEYEICEGATAHPDVENPELVVKFFGEDVDLLLANRAEVLLALEHLTMEALRMASEDHSRICFDANDHRMLRIEELRMSATTAAERVKRTGVPFAFNPMNSRERRVIHVALRNEHAVRSESAGIGPHRQVVIYPAGMRTPAQAPVPRGNDSGRPAPRSRNARR
ncbi:MAG: R3H domain-containing nucleic acid-binding protein [Bryobacteraceae bacterium]